MTHLFNETCSIYLNISTHGPKYTIFNPLETSHLSCTRAVDCTLHKPSQAAASKIVHSNRMHIAQVSYLMQYDLNALVLSRLISWIKALFGTKIFSFNFFFSFATTLNQSVRFLSFFARPISFFHRVEKSLGEWLRTKHEKNEEKKPTS